MTVLLLILLKITPIFLVMILGYVAFVAKWIDDGFIISANRLVFYIAMPALVFLSVSSADFSGELPWREVLSFIGAIILTTIAGYAFARILKLDPPRKGPFLQGMVRGNFAIIGLAVVDQVLGSSWLPHGAVLLAFFLLIHNVASVLILTSCAVDSAASSHPLKKLGLVVLRSFQNPLTVAIIAGIIFSVNSITLPKVFADALGYLRFLALPLALVGIGGSVGRYATGGRYPIAAASSFFKLVIMPGLALLFGVLMGVRDEPLLILSIYAGAPAAVASYAMTDAMGGDRHIAGSIIVVSTAACFITMSLFLAILQISGLG